MVKHLITEAERPLVFTDRAMTESSAPTLLSEDMLAAELEAEERALSIERSRGNGGPGSATTVA